MLGFDTRCVNKSQGRVARPRRPFRPELAPYPMQAIPHPTPAASPPRSRNATPASGIPDWLAWLAPDRRPAPDAIATADWGTIPDTASAHHVAPALCAKLRALDALDSVPAVARDRLLHAYEAARLEALIWRRALGIVLPALAAEGILAVPYKGAALAFSVYPEPAVRSMSDIDLWIDAPDMAGACAVMERLGFEPKVEPDRPPAMQARYDGELPYRGRRIGVPLVELQWGVFPGEWLNRTARIDRVAVRARTTATTLVGHPVRLLAPEDHLVQLALHVGVTHVFSQATLRSLLDLVVLACHGVDWDAVVARGREWRVAGVLGHALHLAGDLFSRSEFRAAGDRLIEPRRKAQLYRHIGPLGLLQQQRLDAGASKWRYLTAAVDHRGDRWRLVARSLWPEAEWLGARYQRTGLRIRAKHLAGALRGRF
jgi:hypothetical protein